MELVAGASNDVGSNEASCGEGLLCFAEDYDRGAAAAGCDSKACGETDLEIFHLERFGKDINAEPFSEHDGIDGAAAGEGEEKLVVADASEQVVAAHEALDAAGDLAEEVIAGLMAEFGIPVGEVVNVDEQ